MKNIIKRSTSLLLVVAMLLSFAVVVGAEPAAGTSTTGAHLMLWADTVPLEAGKVAYVPIYAKIDAAYGVGALQFNVWCDSGISLLSVTNEKDDTSSAAKGSFAAEKDGDGGAQRVGWSNTTPLGWTRDAEYNLVAPTTDILVCWAVVKPEANMTAGSYGIHFGPFKGLETSKPFKIISANGETVSDEKTAEDVTMTDGTAIVYDESEPPMVALTKTTFDVPTMEQQEKDVLNAGKYVLADYLKIVGQDSNGEVKVYPVDKNALDWSVTQNPGGVTQYSSEKLAIDTQTGKEGTAKLTISAAKAASDSSIAIPAAQEVSFTVRKAETGLWKASFAAYNGRYMNANAFLTGSDFDTDEDGNKYVSAKAYDANSTTYKSVTIRPTAFDKYGQKLENVKANFEINLYSDAECKVSCTDSHVGKNNLQDELSISNQLERDVYCKVRTYVLDAQNNKVYGEEATFLIKSTKPYAARAEVVLKGVDGKEITDSISGKPVYTFAVPDSTQPQKELTIDAWIYDQNEKLMTDDKPTFTVSAGFGGTNIPTELVNGLSFDATTNKLTITKDALKRLVDGKCTFTVTIKVDNKELGTATITLTRAPSVATSIGSVIEHREGGYTSTPGEIGSSHADKYSKLPGIHGDTDKASFGFNEVYVLDQYGQKMQKDGADWTVPADKFHLYPAKESTDPDAVENSNKKKYKKADNAVAFPATNVEFTNSGNNVQITMKNSKDAAGNLALNENVMYIVAAEYEVNGQTLVAYWPFSMSKVTDKTYTVTGVKVTNAANETVTSIDVPKAGESDVKLTLTAQVEDQYGETPAEGTTVTMTPVGDKFSLYDSKGKHEGDYSNKSTAVNVTSNDDGTITITVGKDLVRLGYMKNTVLTGELQQQVQVTVGTQKLATTTAKVNVKREASALKTATVVMKQGETVMKTVKLTDESSSTQQQTINMISPKANTTYTFTVTCDDQYGDTMEGVSFSGAHDQNSLTSQDATWVNSTLNVLKDNIKGTTNYSAWVNGVCWRLTINFAPMQFVNGNGEQYTIGKLLDTTKLSKVYNRDTWYHVIEGASAVTGPNDENSKVYIENADGENTDVTQKIWAEVIDKTTGQTVYDARDSLADPAGPTASATEKAGTYIVKIFYREKEGDAPIEVCSSGEFTISPKPITIGFSTADGKIEKPYDGGTTLPEGVELKPEGVVGNDNVIIDLEALKFAQKDVKLKDDGTVDSMAIQLVEGKDCLQLPGEKVGETFGGPATNYTVKLDSSGNVEGLTGKITKKALTSVTVTYEDKPWDNTDDATGTPAITYVGAIDNEQITINVTGAKYTSSNVDATVTSGTVTLGDDAVSKNYTLPSTIAWSGKIVKATFTIKLDGNKSFTYGNEGDNLKVKPEQLYVGNTQISGALATYFTETARVPVLGVTDTNQPNSRGHYDQTSGNRSDYLLAVPEGNTNYTFEFYEPGYTLTVNPLSITIKLKTTDPERKLTKTYDGTTALDGTVDKDWFDFELPYGIGLPSGETLSVDPTMLAYNSADAGNKKTIGAKYNANGNREFPLTVEAGNADITATGRTNYSVAVSLTGTITPKDLTVTPKSMDNLVYGKASDDARIEAALALKNVDETLTITGFDGDCKAPQFEGKLVLKKGEAEATKTEGHYNAGTYTVAADASLRETTGNYTINFTNGSWTIKPAAENSALGDLNDLQATRNKTNEITLDTNYPLDGDATITVTVAEDTEDWIKNNDVSAKYEDGEIKITLKVEDGTVNDSSKIKLKVTIPAGGNYGKTEKTFDVKIINKNLQTNFKINEGSEGTYSYSKGGLQLTTSGSVKDSKVKWSISTGQQAYATVDANGYVTFHKPTKTGSLVPAINQVWIVAKAEETTDYAAASDTYKLTITKGDITVTASSATMTAGEALPGFSATASGLNPNDSVSSVFQTLTASVSTDGKTAGTYPVTPNATFKTSPTNWSEYYNAPRFVQGTLTVNPATSVIDTILPTIIAGNGCANGYANCACEIFYDLDASRWYHEAVDWAYNLGLMNGTTKSTFGPNAAATRAQTWTMLARIAGQDTGRSVTWYEVGRTWAMGLGITDGTNPMGTLTREQLAAMLYRYVGSPAVSGTLTFTDSANVSTWAKDAMVWAVQNGILDGVGGNRLNPKGTTTRAQAAAIFMRFSKLINK